MSEPDATRRGTVVLGLGNPLLGDDGLGLAALARLDRRWRIGGDVALLDGGTWGMSLLPTLEGAARVLLLDAIDHGAPPGTPARFADDAIPRAWTRRLSPHQIDLREVLAVCALRGTLPPAMVALGLQPAALDETTGGLTPALATGLDALVDAAAAELARWGHRVRRRPAESTIHRVREEDDDAPTLATVLGLAVDAATPRLLGGRLGAR